MPQLPLFLPPPPLPPFPPLLLLPPLLPPLLPLLPLPPLLPPEPPPPLEPIEVAVLVNDVERLEPSVRMPPMQTATIMLNITAYSTAVGPLSSPRNLRRNPLIHLIQQP